MANSQVAMTEGSGKNAATYSISEGTTKEIQRMALNTNAGVEIATAAAPLQVSVANTGANATAVKVDGSAVTQPVSLTSTTITGTAAVTQSGTWTVQPGNTANTTAWKVDGSAVTQPTSLASTTITSLVPGVAATSLGKAEDAAHTSGDTGVMALGVRNDAGTTLANADGDYIPLSIDAAGALRVTGGGGGTQYVEDVAAAADPTGNMLIAVRRDTLSTSEVSADGDNIALKASNKGKLHVAAETRFGDVVADTGSGTGGSATQRVIVDSSQLSALGQTTASASAPVVLASDQSWSKGLSNKVFSVAMSTLTRPANTTAYTALDSISDNATAGSVTALTGTISDVNDDPLFISEILINSTDTGLAGKRIRAYLYNSDPTASTGVVGGDNAAFSNKKAGYVGSFSGVLETGFSDGAVGRLVPSYADGVAASSQHAPAGGFIVTKPVSGAKTLFIQYQAVDAFTPSANSTTIIGTVRGWQARIA